MRSMRSTRFILKDLFPVTVIGNPGLAVTGNPEQPIPRIPTPPLHSIPVHAQQRALASEVPTWDTG
jgi:hypothetical protein